MTTAADLVAAFPASAGIAEALVALGARLGANPFHLAAVIRFESGFNPAARNPTSDASGLIQFMPSTAKGLGTTVEAIRGMTAQQQLPLVEAYFRPYKGRLGSLQAVAMAVFYPVAMSWPPTQEFPAKVQAWNPGIKTPADYVAWVTRKAGGAGRYL